MLIQNNPNKWHTKQKNRLHFGHIISNSMYIYIVYHSKRKKEKKKTKFAIKHFGLRMLTALIGDESSEMHHCLCVSLHDCCCCIARHSNMRINRQQTYIYTVYYTHRKEEEKKNCNRQKNSET